MRCAAELKPIQSFFNLRDLFLHFLLLSLKIRRILRNEAGRRWQIDTDNIYIGTHSNKLLICRFKSHAGSTGIRGKIDDSKAPGNGELREIKILSADPAEWNVLEGTIAGNISSFLRGVDSSLVLHRGRKAGVKKVEFVPFLIEAESQNGEDNLLQHVVF